MPRVNRREVLIAAALTPLYILGRGYSFGIRDHESGVILIGFDNYRHNFRCTWWIGWIAFTTRPTAAAAQHHYQCGHNRQKPKAEPIASAHLSLLRRICRQSNPSSVD